MMNLQNNNNNTGFYPMYLGEELGLIDNIHETYPEIANLRDVLMRNRWDWREIDLSQDARDMHDPDLRDGVLAFNRNLSFQYAADTIASTSIAQVMVPYCSNSELLGLLQEWEGNEYVHAMQYSEITKKVYEDPNELMEEIKANTVLIDRLQPIQDVFDETRKMAMMYELGLDRDRSRHARQIIVYHGTLLALEGIAFAASFAATFGVSRAFKAFEGTKNAVQLITRDELDTHVSAGLAILRNLRKEFPAEYSMAMWQLQKIYDAVYALELEWLDHLFDGISIRGLNKPLLDQYVRYLMAPICDAIGINFNYERVKENPLPWMDEYLALGDIQVAAQETQLVNYNLNIIDDDIGSKINLNFPL